MKKKYLIVREGYTYPDGEGNFIATVLLIVGSFFVLGAVSIGSMFLFFASGVSTLIAAFARKYFIGRKKFVPLPPEEIGYYKIIEQPGKAGRPRKNE